MAVATNRHYLKFGVNEEYGILNGVLKLSNKKWYFK